MSAWNRIDSLAKTIDKTIDRNDRFMEQIAELEDMAVKPAAEVRPNDLAQISLLAHTMICGKIENSRSHWRMAAVILGIVTALLSGGLVYVLSW